MAVELLKLIQSTPTATLGLATGNTMTEIYPRLSELLTVNCVNLNDIKTFNLDEYVGLNSSHPQSYYTYMHQLLFDHNDWNERNVYIPRGDAPHLEEEAQAYEQRLASIGQPDIQLLGIGENGHIGFNEPGTPFNSQTRIVDLTDSTIKANSIHFDTIDDVPKQAISMGLQSIMRAKRIILLAFGERKQEAISRLIHGPKTETLPASILQTHPNVEIIVDDVIFNHLNNITKRVEQNSF